MRRVDFVIHLLAVVLICLAFGAGAVSAAIWGVRVNPDTAERRRWQTTAEYVQFEVPDHGLVEVRLSADGQLFIESLGDADGPRSLVVRGLVVNQVRIGFER